VIEDRQPSLLLDNSVLITGEIDRTTDFERGLPHHQAHRHGEWEPDPLILDDQALIVNVATAASPS
jgi:7,8-dihydropterin-6-yl-methyl-4-(beta-D-ribofuranosyl)aminobenzene 5'-phosphate synthase